MRVCAHERTGRKSKTVLMDSRELRAKSEWPDLSIAGDATENYRYSVVSDWYDADGMEFADISDEVAGQRVVVFAGPTDHVMQYSPAAVRGTGAGVPGFIFNGDDGDSLWFWPESEDIALRFEPETAKLLRRELSESVIRLVSQGALVFCRKIDNAAQGDVLFEFPALEENAA